MSEINENQEEMPEEELDRTKEFEHEFDDDGREDSDQGTVQYPMIWVAVFAATLLFGITCGGLIGSLFVTAEDGDIFFQESADNNNNDRVAAAREEASSRASSSIEGRSYEADRDDLEEIVRYLKSQVEGATVLQISVATKINGDRVRDLLESYPEWFSQAGEVWLSQK
ncbi:Hypothetical protein PBC10988_15410 [Planctomycetales bacterium 10988]|nr:Hypothetical protein PBC10988_15410 [Planctomycetales bacterium 10988]